MLFVVFVVGLGLAVCVAFERFVACRLLRFGFAVFVCGFWLVYFGLPPRWFGLIMAECFGGCFGCCVLVRFMDLVCVVWCWYWWADCVLVVCICFFCLLYWWIDCSC